MAIGIIVAPVIPHAGIIMTSLIVCILMAWLLHRWALVQSIAVLLCFFLMGMLVGQRAERPHRHQRKVPSLTAQRPLSRMERVQQRCLDYRQTLLDRYRTSSSSDDEYAVLAAMTLVDKSALTKELRETYSKTGASHILALSGLHLGIIYMLLSYLTLGRRRRFLREMITLAAIWSYVATWTTL